jgi:hypothetical protein
MEVRLRNIYSPATKPEGGSALAKDVALPLDSSLGLTLIGWIDAVPEADAPLFFRVSEGDTGTNSPGQIA